MRLCVNNISQLHLFQNEFIDVILATVESRLVLEKKYYTGCVDQKPMQQINLHSKSLTRATGFI